MSTLTTDELLDREDIAHIICNDHEHFIEVRHA